jgi:AcrR family transcriptional regulator
MSTTDAVALVASYPHGRVPREVRERQILALAEQLFAERGYQDTSMDELARRAAVSKPIIYSLIGNKDELYRRAFESAAAELAERVADAARDPSDLAAMLRATANAFFEFIDQHRGAWRMLVDSSAGKLAAYVDEIRAGQARFTAELLAARAAEEGRAVDTAALDATAHMLNGAYEMLARWWNEHPEVGTDTLAEWLVQFALPGLEAITRDEPPSRA